MKNNKIPSILNRKCPICYHDRGYILHRLSYLLFDDNPMPSEVDVVYCESCGFVFYDTPITETELQKFYSYHYLINSYDFRVKYPPEILYLKEMAGFIKNLNLSTDAKVTDVGCGPGHLLKFIKEEGYYNLCGVELCENYIQKLNLEGINAVFGSAMCLPEESQNSECFIYKWIFEHLLDLHQPIKSLIEKINYNGFVVVEVPDAASYDIFADHTPLNHFILEHINHFSLHHLSEIFKIYGFEKVQVYSRLNDQHEAHLFPQMCVIFRYKGGLEKKEIVPDYSLASAIRLWFEHKPNFNYPDLINICNKRIPVHIWGLSYRTLMKIAMSPLKDANIAGFYDKDPEKQQKTLLGNPILSPDLLKNVSNSDVIVIGVGPSSSFMVEQIKSFGFCGKIISL